MFSRQQNENEKMRWPEGEKKSITTTNTCCSPETREWWRLASSRLMCVISQWHRPLLDSVSNDSRWQAEREMNSSRTLTRGPVKALRPSGGGCSQQRIVHLLKVIFCLAAHVRAICSARRVALRSNHESIPGLEARAEIEPRWHFVLHQSTTVVALTDLGEVSQEGNLGMAGVPAFPSRCVSDPKVSPARVCKTTMLLIRINERKCCNGEDVSSPLKACKHRKVMWWFEFLQEIYCLVQTIESQ